MTRQNTILVGVAAIVAIIGAGLMFGVLPQNSAAAEARSTKAELAQNNSLLTVQLASLRKQKADMGALNDELAALHRQIPPTADLASVTRVIVNALEGPNGSKGAKLVSITPQVPPIPFTPNAQLAPGIGLPEVPTPAPAGSADESTAPAGSFQEVPLMITATAVDVAAAFRFIDFLNNGPRLLAVRHVEVIKGDAAETAGGKPSNSVTVSVVGAAFLKPVATEPAPVPAG